MVTYYTNSNYPHVYKVSDRPEDYKLQLIDENMLPVQTLRLTKHEYDAMLNNLVDKGWRAQSDKR